MTKTVLLSGLSHVSLSRRIAQKLSLSLAPLEIHYFSDQEISVKLSQSMQDCHVYVIQSTCHPVNNHLMELLITADALKRAGSKEITAVFPYFGYARQDRKGETYTAITARLVADLLETAGITQMICLDLHAIQMEGFFRIPVKHLHATSIFLNYFLKTNHFTDQKLVVVSPDTGSVERAGRLAHPMGASMAFIDKKRALPNTIQEMTIMDNIYNKTVLLFDDIIDTAHTIITAAETLQKQGAKSIYAAATHGVFSGDALQRLEASCIQKIFITDSIPMSAPTSSKIQILSVADLLANAIYPNYHKNIFSPCDSLLV